MDSISIYRITGISKHFLASSKDLRKSCKVLIREPGALLELSNPFWGTQRCCVFKTQKWNNLITILLMEPMLTRAVSMLELAEEIYVVVKVTMLVRLVQKFLWYSFVKRTQFAQTGTLLFDRTEMLFTSELCKILFLGGVTVKRLQISTLSKTVTLLNNQIKIFRFR